MADKFLHEKELQQYCRELDRDMRRADKEYDKWEFGPRPDAKKSAAALKWQDRIAKQMHRIESIVYFENRP